MLSRKIRILDFDNSVAAQEGLIRRFLPEVIDLKSLGPLCRVWCRKETARRVRSALTPDSKNAVTFLGSGDFHHVTSILAEQFEEPISVIVFDHHPDWDTFPPRLGYASWVRRLLDRKNVKKIILLGVSSCDISSIHIEHGSLDSLADDRVEIYPYSHKPTRVFLRRVPENRSIRLSRAALSSVINWRELKTEGLRDVLLSVIKMLDTKKVYVSIDKDCLKKDHSLTNWEEGRLTLDELLGALRLIKENLDIVGLDITGDYSHPVVKGSLKKIYLAVDHPRDYSAKGHTKDRIASINEETNIKILETLSG